MTKKQMRGTAPVQTKTTEKCINAFLWLFFRLQTVSAYDALKSSGESLPEPLTGSQLAQMSIAAFLQKVNHRGGVDNCQCKPRTASLRSS